MRYFATYLAAGAAFLLSDVNTVSAAPVDANARQPQFDNWVTTGQTDRYAFADLYHVDDPDDPLEEPRWAGTLSMVCVDRDHLEYRVTPTITNITVGHDYPNPAAPRPFTISRIANGNIGAADSVKLAGFFVKYIAALEAAGDAGDDFYYVDLTTGGRALYVTLKGFTKARDDMRTSCWGPQSKTTVAQAAGAEQTPAAARQPVTPPTDAELVEMVRTAYPAWRECSNNAQVVIDCFVGLKHVVVRMYIPTAMKSIVNVEFTTARNIYVWDEVAINDTVHAMVERFGISRDQFTECVSTFAFSKQTKEFSLPNYELTCTTQTSNKSLRFFRR